MYLTRGMTLLVEEVVPGLHGRRFSYWDAYLPQDSSIQSLLLHADRHLVDARHVFALHHALQVYITKRCHLHAQVVIQMTLGTQHQNVGLNTHTLQFLHRVLCRFGLQLIGGFQIRYIRKMYAHRIAPQFPAQLSDGLHERCTLNVADGTTHLGDDEVESLPKSLAQHSPLDLVRDVRHHLNRLAQIVATTLAVDDGLVDATCCNTIVACGMNTRKALVVP